MIDLEKYKSDNGFYNATHLLNDYNDKHGTKRTLSRFLHTPHIKAFMADMVVQMNITSGTKEYNKNNIKMAKFGHDGYTLFIPELFAKFVLWLYKNFEKDVFKFVLENGYKFHADDHEILSFVSSKYFRYYEGKVDILILHREVNLCRIKPKLNSFTREDVTTMNISMIVNGVPFEARKNILYKQFL